MAPTSECLTLVRWAMSDGVFDLRLKAAEGIARILFLHRGRAADCVAPPVREEERKDSEKGTPDCVESYEGNQR